MKSRKILLALLCSAVFASSAFAEGAKSVGNMLRDKLDAAKEAAVEAVDKAVDKVVDIVFESEGPERALTVREPNSTYFVLRLDSLSDFLRYIISKDNLSIFAPFAELDDEAIKSITDCLAKLPMRETALLIGSTDEKKPFIQAAVSMPDDMAGKLGKIAEGIATPKEIASMFVGEDSELLLIAAGMLADARFEDGVYMLDETAALGAKDGLLLMAYSPDDVRASFKAIADGSGRLPFKRTFDAKDFLIMHADPKVMAARMREAADLDEGTVQNYNRDLSKILKGPVDFEMAFEPKSDRFIMSGHVDPSCFTDEYLASHKNDGYALDIIGGDVPMLILAAESVPSLETLGTYIPNIKELVDQLREFPQMIGVSNETAADLFSGGMSAALTGSVAFEGARLPGGYLTFTGRNGAAAKVFDALLKAFTTDGIGSSVIMPGWDNMLQVNPQLLPVPLFIGARGETLFAGMMNDSSITAPAANLPDELSAIAGKKASSSYFIDVKSLLAFLQDEDKNHIKQLITQFADDEDDILADIFAEAISFEPSITCISSISDPASNSFRTEFLTAEVPADKGLWAKIAKLVPMFAGDMFNEGDDSEE